MTLNTKIPAGSHVAFCSAVQSYQNDAENFIMLICFSASEQLK